MRERRFERIEQIASSRSKVPKRKIEKAQDKAIEYLACLMYSKETNDNGFMPFLWRVIRQEIKDKYIQRACNAILIWDGEEQEAEDLRKRSKEERPDKILTKRKPSKRAIISSR